MVRPIYRLNRVLDPVLIFGDKANKGLNGFRDTPFPEGFGVDWNLLFGDARKPPSGNGRVQPSYKTDTSLVDPLSNLPEFMLKDANDDFIFGPDGKPLPAPGAVPNLSMRNLMRGRSMSLPCGQDVARAMGFVPLRDDQLFIGKATAEDWPGAELLASLDIKDKQGQLSGTNTHFAGKAPLWTYILAEAAWEWSQKAFPGGDRKNAPRAGANRISVHLGDVGSTIIAETFIGLLMGDAFSFFKQDPLFVPRNELTQSGHGRDFSAHDLVRPR